MKPSSPAFIMYLIASFFAVMGIAMKNDLLVLLMKPIIVPSVFFYYMQVKESKINWLFSIALLLSFAADMIILFDLEDGDIPVALLNIGMYLIFIYFSIKDMPNKNLSVFNFSTFLLIVIAFLIVSYIVLDMMTGLDNFMHNLFLIYGIVLSVLASVIVFNHMKFLNIKTFYAVIMCICFVTSDIFFAIYNFYLKMEVFTIFNVTVQFASYYYMVKYFTSKVEVQDVIYEK
ncbi:lysoplasmalogenase family protein [Flavobacterium sp.]|uniref:lysoplasmalogenase family protein n=1 Tax=Flavobacterium sp. TaxID=239 RepID=UPI00262AFB6F|nr:lysoplasmalogenase family protein [Flavobacterium sp.]